MGRFLTYREMLLKAGFNPEKGKILIEYTVEWYLKLHTPECEEEPDDWGSYYCSCPHKTTIIIALVPWRSKIFDEDLRKLGNPYAYVAGEENTDSRRDIGIEAYAVDDKAVYTLHEYDGDKWLEATLLDLVAARKGDNVVQTTIKHWHYKEGE